MMITRQLVLEKISAYLNHQLSQQELYEWWLGLAVAGDLEQTLESDPLLKNAFNAIMEINRQNVAKVPTRKALEYYRRCLAGEMEFIPLESHRELHKLNIPDIPEEIGVQGAQGSHGSFQKRNIRERVEDWKYFQDAILTARLYVIIFAICSLVVQIFSLINPGFLRIGLLVPTHWQAFADAFPHIVYAYVVLLPPKKLITTRMFLLAFPLLMLGLVFYWTIACAIITKLDLPWVALVVISPFSVIPAALALALVLMEKWGLNRSHPAQNSLIAP
jgi:hypothetical protein